MDEYIDRKSLINEFDRLGLGEHSFVERVFSDGVRTIIAGIPAADVAPVVHGQWVTHYRSGTTVAEGYVSTCCDMWNNRKSDYCPNCGARMDGDSDAFD